MENWWTNKSSSTLPSMASSSSQELRNQMENSTGYFSCSQSLQDVRPMMLGRLQDPLLSSIQSAGSHRSKHDNLGNSFLSLLSGSPSLLHRDSQEFSLSKAMGTSGPILCEGNNSILKGSQSATPLSTSGLPSEKFSWKNMQSGRDFRLNGSSKVLPSSISASNPVLHDLQSSDLTKVVTCHMIPGNEKVNSYSLSGEWHSASPASKENIQTSEEMPVEVSSFMINQASRICHSGCPADTGKASRKIMCSSQKLPPEANSFISYQASGLCHGPIPADSGKGCKATTDTSPKIPVEACSFASDPASNLMNGCPRVFCSTTSGYLLLSNTGLLGIVCSCHAFRMSASKFCEHSGLYGVNPGNVIHMDSGETIAQWCKLYLLKFGIRIPADKSEWDWPAELSASAGLMKSNVPMPKIPNSLSDLVSSPGNLVSSKRKSEGVPLSNNYIAGQSFVLGAVSNKQQRNIQDSNNIFHKALTGTSQSNLHMADNLIMERAMSISKFVGYGEQGNCQSISAYTGSMHDRTSSITHPYLQEGRMIGKESNFCRIDNTKDGAFQDGTISNIELRLGQPYQLAKTSGTTDISAVGPQFLATAVNPMKSLFPQQLIGANCMEGRQHHYFSADPSNPSINRDQDQSNNGNNAFVVRNATDGKRVGKFSSNLPQDSVNSFLINLKSPPTENPQTKVNNYIFNDSGNSLRNSLNSEPLKYDLATVLWSGGSTERQLDMSQLGLYKQQDNNKVLSFAAHGSHLANDYTSLKEMENSSSFNRLTGSGEPNVLTAHRNSCYSRQSGSDSRMSSDYPQKVISFQYRGKVDHAYPGPVAASIGSGMKFTTQAVSTGIPVSASTSIADRIPSFCREEFIGVHTHMPLQELSKQQHVLPTLSMNQGEGRVICSSYMQHSLVDTSTSTKQTQKLSVTSKHDVSEDAVMSHQSGFTCRIGGDEGFASMPGVNCCCHFSRYEQGSDPKVVGQKHQTSVASFCNRQPSPRSGKNITEPGERERCFCKVPCGYFCGSSSCEAYRNCLERDFESKVGRFLLVSKEQRGTVNCENSMIFSPQLANSPIVSKNKTDSVDHKRKLSGELPKNNPDHTSQWRDVPNKVKAVSDVTRVDRLANLFDATRQDREKLADTCAKCSNGTVQMADSLKEHEVSNISSGCSAPAVSQPSIEVNNVDCSTNDAGDNECGSNFVADEGSGIDEAWASDDARESEKCAKFLASTGSSMRKFGSPKNSDHQSSASLLDELKLLNSLTWQKGRDQIPPGLALHKIDKHPQSSERGLKNGKRKREVPSEILNASCLSLNPSGVQQDPKSNDTSQFTSQSSRNLKMLFPSRKLDTHRIGHCNTEASSGPSQHTSSPAKKLLCRSDLHILDNGKKGELNDGKKNCEITEVSGGKKWKKDCSSSSFLPSQVQESSQEGARNLNHNSVDCFKTSSRQKLNAGHRKARPVVCGKYGELADGSLTGEMSKPAKLVPLSRVLDSARKCTPPKHSNSKSTSKRELKKKNLGEAVSNIYELTERGEDLGLKSLSTGKISNCLSTMKDNKLVNTGEDSGLCQLSAKNSTQEHMSYCDLDSAASCCVCGSSNQDEINAILECSQCLIKVHQACYGVSKVPKGCWSCRPCRACSKDIVCVLCGYGGGAMTQALRSQTIVKSILRAWSIETNIGPKNELCSTRILQKGSTGLHCSDYGHEGNSLLMVQYEHGQPLTSAPFKRGISYKVNDNENSPNVSKIEVQNSITVGLVDSSIKQWVHMVCGLWTPETRCPNVDTMSAFDVAGVPLPTAEMVCCMCKREGGSCIQCRVENCFARFHPWCAHQKGLLQTEVEGIDNENVGFYGRCSLHATLSICKSDYPIDTESGCLDEEKLACARTEGYKGRRRDGFRHNYYDRSKGSGGCLVPQEQLNAWAYINGQKSCRQELSKLAVLDIEHDSRKEYTRNKQAKYWKHLVVYKSGIHALGLYTSRFISRDEMVVEYVGEIVGQRVADNRETEYQSGKKLQYKSACYFFRIDKDHIIDATCKGGIARFVNHSCSPNCVAKVLSVRNEKKVVFFAERDIFPGEEITYDYHFNHEDEGKKIPCYCNSKNCRRYLN